MGNRLDDNLEALVLAEARAASCRGADMLAGSRAWNAKIHGGHELFDDVPYSADDAELLRALRMLARWWLRTVAWVHDGLLPEETSQRERLPMRMFHYWIEKRFATATSKVLADLFSDLIFAQHVKVALMRFDGEVQRLRFTIGDQGIIPTAEVGNRLGEHPHRMLDRLPSFIGLLCDVGVLGRDGEGRLVRGTTSWPTA
jgi:hypothetical protein